ncbi:MAG: efflux RND transporter periplasmic adaptor subunit [Candidatus Eremiobacteraeota bacterium]|nr:efflux RND transporter periplasmic adaptor subunit [Candidatus Eremiobacteraeota bacterium]
MNSRLVRIAAAAAVAIVVIVIIIFSRSHKSPAPADTADTAPTVDSTRAKFGSFVVHVNAAGRIGAPAGSQAKLSFAGSGLIQTIDVSVGQRVLPGQVLAQLDTSALQIDAAAARADAAAAAASYGGGSVPSTAVASAQARVAAAQAKLKAAQNQTGSANSDAAAAQTAARQSEEKVAADRRALDRAQQIYAAGVGARKDVEAARSQLSLDQADLTANRSRVLSATSSIGGATAQARADYQQALNDLRAAQAQIGVTGAQSVSAQNKAAQAEHAVANATLRAPEAGVVLQLLKHVGEAVDPTQPVIVVGPQSDRSVTLTVAGADGALVRVGNAVTVTDPTRRSTAAGRVVAVVPAVDPSTQTTTVVASGVPPDSAPGNAVTASIDVATHRGIIVPTTALIDDPQTGKTMVFVRSIDKNGDQKYAPREVTVATSDERSALIRTGLRNGDVVAAQGAFDLLAPAGGG